MTLKMLLSVERDSWPYGWSNLVVGRLFNSISFSSYVTRKKKLQTGNSLSCLESMTEPDWKPIQMTAGANKQCTLDRQRQTHFDLHPNKALKSAWLS